jgi:hypothetical protein
MLIRDDIPIWFFREELSKWLNRDIPPWLWANLAPQYLVPKIPPDLVLDPQAAESKTLWNHFGLDVKDIEIYKLAGYLDGFRAWFLLQHFRGYKPFITKITFEKDFDGDLNNEVK